MFFDKNAATDENKIVAGEGLPSAANEFDEEAKVAVVEEKASASEAKEEPKEKAQPEKKESEKKVVAKEEKAGGEHHQKGHSDLSSKENAVLHTAVIFTGKIVAHQRH